MLPLPFFLTLKKCGFLLLKGGYIYIQYIYSILALSPSQVPDIVLLDCNGRSLAFTDICWQTKGQYEW